MDGREFARQNAGRRFVLSYAPERQVVVVGHHLLDSMLVCVRFVHENDAKKIGAWSFGSSGPPASEFVPLLPVWPTDFGWFTHVERLVRVPAAPASAVGGSGRRFPHRCPACAGPAFVMAVTVECEGPKCRLHVPGARGAL